MAPGRLPGSQCGELQSLSVPSHVTAEGEAALTDEAARAALADALAAALAETLGEFNAREQTP